MLNRAKFIVMNTLNKRFVSALKICAVLFAVQQISFAQPPPPHPGGSGNQGAPIDGGLIALCVAGAAFGLKAVQRKK